MRSTKQTLLRNLLSRLSSAAFEEFAFQLLSDAYGDKHFKTTPELGEGIAVRDLPDYIYSPEEGEKDHFGIFDGIYIIHFLPFEVLKDPRKINLNDPGLISRLKNIVQTYKEKPFGYLQPSGFVNPRLQSIYFLNNYSGFSRKEHTNYLIPKYEDLLNKLGVRLELVAVGNYDSFLENKPKETERGFRNFIATRKEGIRISFSESDLNIGHFDVEKHISNGVSRGNRDLYQPVYLSKKTKQDRVLSEFEVLIRSEPRESLLEEFLTTHYSDIFGYGYDRVETQLWLRFPELDIDNRDRRFDIFLRNIISNDWELFEVKPMVPLTGTYRDVPVLSREVMNAMQQVKNYARILSQDSVKKRLASEGIVYYEPSMNLIVGKRPEIPINQWRWLLDSNKDVKLITYENLLSEMKLHYNDRLRFLGSPE